jgi:tyrosine-protein kinase Etk/Wzc
MAPELLAYHTPDNPVVARYTELLSSVREAASVKKVGDRAILSLCPIRGSIGCSTVLLNLAIVSARQGRRTLVLDANAKAPALAARLGIATAPGLMEILAGDATVEQAIQSTDQDNLFALTAGQQGPLLADVQTLYDLLAQVRKQFDLVLIDGPRWDGKPATTALASASDTVFLVVPASEAEATPATDWLRTLPQQGIRLAGTILTAY